MQYGFGCCCQQLHQLFVPLGLQLMHLLACWAESQPCWECIVPNACCLTELLKELVVRSQKNVRQRAFLVTKHKLLFQELSCSSVVLCQVAVDVGGLLLFQVVDVWWLASPLFARKASMLVHACHLALSSLCTRLCASCSFHGFACWGVHGGCLLAFFFPCFVLFSPPVNAVAGSLRFSINLRDRCVFSLLVRIQ